MTLATLTTAVILLAQAGMPAGLNEPPPELDVRLLAARESAAPGGSVELAVEIEVPKRWHIYHPIVLDTGLPTSVELTVPPGVEVAPLRWPQPKLGETVGIEYLGFEGTITALATLTLPADAPVGQSLRIDAKVSGLACIEACVPVETRATLTLPVTAEPGAPAHAKEFEAARGRLAPPLGETERLKGSTIAFSKSTLGVGDQAEIVAKLNIADGWHIQARDPGVPGLIPTRLFVEPVNGLKIADEEDWKWPKPKTRTIEYVGTVREFGGAVEVRIPVELVDPKFKRGEVAVRALVQFQACDDAGVCEPPVMAAALLRFTADTEADPRGTPWVRHDAGQWVSGEGEAAVADAGAEGDGADSGATAGTDNAGAADPNAAAPPARKFSIAELLLAIGGAFLGGLLLNIMPCVLPVISLKVMSFMQQGGEDPARVFRLGLAFCLGIMVWFWMFAGLSLIGNVPLQNQWVVLGLATLLFVMALNLFGVFEIALPGSVATKMDEASGKEGYSGAFFKGLLATLLGTACTAPALAGALAYALTQPASVTFTVFTFAGLGMSAPYLLLAARPAWLKYVPKPGAWMTTFKQSMGFILVGTVVWLLTIIGAQMGTSGVVWAIGFWSFLSLSVFLIGKIGYDWSPNANLTTSLAALFIAVFGGWFSFGYMYEPPGDARTTAYLTSGPAGADGGASTDGSAPPRINVSAILAEIDERGWDDGIPWIHYTAGIDMAQQIAASGRPAYIDYTADWCVNCKVNKNTVLETNDIRGLMKELGVVPLEADFTRKNPVMRDEILGFGANSVPVNVIYPANRPDQPIVLPTMLSKGAVEARLREAAAPAAGAEVEAGERAARERTRAAVP